MTEDVVHIQPAADATAERVRALLYPLDRTCERYRELARDTRQTAASLDQIIRDRPTSIPDIHLTAPSPSLSGPVPDDLDRDYNYLSPDYTVFSARDELPRLATALLRVAEALQFEAEFLETWFGEPRPDDEAAQGARARALDPEPTPDGAAITSANGFPYLDSVNPPAQGSDDGDVPGQ
jgi:hypothetical protein